VKNHREVQLIAGSVPDYPSGAGPAGLCATPLIAGGQARSAESIFPTALVAALCLAALCILAPECLFVLGCVVAVGAVSFWLLSPPAGAPMAMS
jgi:hypothetical protein